MPDPDDDFESRLVVLEREVARLRQQAALTSAEATGARVDAAAARVMAAGADHDVSEVRAELRAHLQALNALRESQVAAADHIGPTANAVFAHRMRVVDSQVVMDVNNALFKILSTS